MILHGYFRSSAAYRCRIACNLKGVSYDAVSVHLRRGGGEQKAPAYRSLNPQALVPALEVDGAVLTQSLAIAEWLDETVPEPPLLPADAIGRAQVRAFALAIACDIHPLQNLRVLDYLRTELGQSQEALDAWCRRWIGDGLAACEALLTKVDRSGPFAFGARPSLADICLVPNSIPQTASASTSRPCRGSLKLGMPAMRLRPLRPRTHPVNPIANKENYARCERAGCLWRKYHVRTASHYHRRGGIGGLAAALGLARKGFRSIVLEKAPQLGEIGAGIQLGPNAFHAFDYLGVGDMARRMAVYIDSLRFMDAMTGEEVTRIPLDDTFRTRFGNPYAVVHRGELFGVFLRACQENPLVELRVGSEVKTYDQDGSSVTAFLANGEAVVGRALIGADGLWSNIRRKLVGDGAPAFRGTPHIVPSFRSKRCPKTFAGTRLHFGPAQNAISCIIRFPVGKPSIWW